MPPRQILVLLKVPIRKGLASIDEKTSGWEIEKSKGLEIEKSGG